VPFDDPRFGTALAERVTWLVREGLRSAELVLNPQELGPIRIELEAEYRAAPSWKQAAGKIVIPVVRLIRVGHQADHGVSG
jgi:hypothetical protein